MREVIESGQESVVTRERSFLDRLGEITDRLVFAISPVRGTQRMNARLKHRAISEYVKSRGLKLGHPVMRSTPSRDSRWYNSRQTIDEQLADDRVDLQQRAVEMIQVNPHAAGAVEGRVAHEIGVGLACRPSISVEDGFDKDKAQAINSRLKRVCKHWSRHGVDRRRQLSLSATQRLACRTYATYGEVFALFREAPYTGPIGLTCEIINPMLVETPPEFKSDENVVMGVRYHPTTDQIVGYYVQKKKSRKHRNPEYDFVPRYNSQGQEQIVHVFEEMFPGQSRGLPWLCSAMAFLKDLDDFHESELISKQVESCFSLIMKGGKESTSPHEIAEGNANREANSKNRIEDIYPGMIHYANDGEEVQVVDPTRPGNTFAPFVEHTLRAAASALNYPYELLAKNFSMATYSSGRLAMLDGQVGFRIRAQVLIDQLLSPLWIRVVEDAFFYGHMEGLISRVEYLADRHRFEDHSWGGHSFGSVDPEKEAKAFKLAVDEDQMTLSEVHAQSDKDWSDVLDQRDAEKRKAIEQEVAREAYRMELRKAAGLPEEGSRQSTADSGQKEKKKTPGGSGQTSVGRSQGSGKAEEPSPALRGRLSHREIEAWEGVAA